MNLSNHPLSAFLATFLTFLFMTGLPSLERIQAQTESTWTAQVSGVCGMCQTRIENQAQGDGLLQASWSTDTRTLTIRYDSSTYSIADAQARILASGHDVNGQKADQNTYRQLPACCQYNAPNNPHLKNKTTLQQVVGVVMEENARGELTPVPYVNIQWQTDPTVRTTSDTAGVFQIPFENGRERLVVSFTGRSPDTVHVENPADMLIIKSNANTLSEVTVTARRSSNFISGLTPERTEMLTSQELFKAACCDLSESFETNASVDVVNSDAITGSKQIQMLGLSGVYTQLTVENLPGPRGLATPLGLGSIAGSWIESIQISKGVGSVVNGFENMTGQINVELKKPENSERLFFNIYGNDMGRTDLNLTLAHQLSEKWSTGILLHDNFMFNKNLDFSNNGFRDLPAGNIFSGISRWKYENSKGVILQFGLKYLRDDRIGGQIDFDPDTDLGTQNSYGIGLDINRYELFSKIGYIFPENRHRSLGLQLSGTIFDQQSYYGAHDYDAQQRGMYANLIYQDIIGTTEHKYRTGLSAQYDHYREIYQLYQFERKEIVPGSFFEYTYSPAATFDVVAGVRTDYNNLYGWFTTPRLQMRYQPSAQTTLRVSTGRGQRTANILAENTAILASSRQLRIDSRGGALAYGLSPEVSWSTGISVDQNFILFGRNASFSAEFFRSDFIDQVVVDYENPREISFYNLDGPSFANSFQTELRFMPAPHLEVRTAYRLFDVKTHYRSIRSTLERPLTARHRGFMNLAYHLPAGNWNFDYTINLSGQKRLPSTEANPIRYRLPEYSKTYATMNAQITKEVGKTKPIDLYIGGENLTNFFQKNPILAADDPFGSYFDTSMIWGPLSGRMIYAGMRFTIR